MTTYMPILGALQSEKLKPEDFIDYRPDQSREMFVRLGETRKLVTEFNLGWHAIIYENFGVLIISDQLTEAYMLVGKKGVRPETIGKYAELYENRELDSIPIFPTPEIYRIVPENLRKNNVCLYKGMSTIRKPLRYKEDRNRFRTYSSAYSNLLYEHHKEYMQPMLFLPPSTIVGIDDNEGAGKSKGRAFKLYPRGTKSCDESKEFLKEFKNPMWIPLAKAMEMKVIYPEDFIEYISYKRNQFYMKSIYSDDEKLSNTQGWHSILEADEGANFVNLVSEDCNCFYTDIYPDIKSGIVKYDAFEKGTPAVLSIAYVQLNLKKYKMIIKLPDNIMVQVNHPEYDGSSLENAYKLKIQEEN